MLSFKTTGNKRQKALIFLHGFLGRKEDFDETILYLENKFYCLSLDLKTPDVVDPYSWIATEIEHIIHFNQLIDPIIVGYSMGGRIAHVFQNLSKISCHTIIIGSHLGIQDSQEKKKRLAWEKKIEEKLSTCSLSAFIDEWYEQTIFLSFKNHSSFKKYAKKRKGNDIDHVKRIFKLFRLTNQPFFPPNSLSHFFCGKYDHKYLKYYRKQKIPFHAIPSCGHVVHLEQPEKLAIKIKEVIYGKSLESKRKIRRH